MQVMRNIVVSLALIIALINIISISMANDTIFPLKNGSSISSSDILSFVGNITLEYGKDYEWNPPPNKQLDYLFDLKQPTDSITFLSYYGTIGIAIKKSKPIIFFGIEIPWIKKIDNYIVYENQSQDFNFLGIFSTSKGANVIDSRFYNITIDNENYKYGYVTNVSYLTPSLSRYLALDYYLLDFADYIQKNASLNKIDKEKQCQLEDLFNKYQIAFQSGDELETALYKEKFYHFAVYEMGNSDEGARKIWNAYINKNSVTELKNSSESKNYGYTPFWHTIFSATIFIILAPIFILITRWKKRYERHGKEAAVAYLSHGSDALLGLVGFAYFISRSPNDLFIFQGWIIVQWIVVIAAFLFGMYLTSKYG